jgi:hypothetical protein
MTEIEDLRFGLMFQAGRVSNFLRVSSFLKFRRLSSGHSYFLI